MSKTFDVDPEIEDRLNPAVHLLLKHYKCVYVIAVNRTPAGLIVDLGGEGDITISDARHVLQHAYNQIMQASIRQAVEQGKYRYGDLLSGNYREDATTRF